ncbi:MAG: LysM peptidoglycan-binding domain-containing protein [Firmicutes bacterium]|nr:LysM peptidoglycan-binding domain-containing protein [Bacillota bacterium]
MPRRRADRIIDQPHEENPAKKEIFRWRMLTLLAVVIAVISLVGVWYANNEKAFLEIENKKLAVEAENLKGRITILQDTIEQNGNLPQGANPKPSTNPKPNTAGATTGKPQPKPSAGGGYDEYTVKAGDTLNGISVYLFGTASYASQIAELNGLTDKSILQLDQKLKVPKNPRP